MPRFHGGHVAGRVTLAGLDTREHGPADLGAFTGVLFQDPETQLVMSSVRAELSLALENRGHSAAAAASGLWPASMAKASSPFRAGICPAKSPARMSPPLGSHSARITCPGQPRDSASDAVVTPGDPPADTSA